MSEFAVAPGTLNVGAVFSQAFATLQSKLLFFVFTGLMVGLASLVGTGGNQVLIGSLLTLAVGAVAQILTVRATTGPHDASSRSTTPTAKPSFARRVHVSAPIPRAPPVTMATRC